MVRCVKTLQQEIQGRAGPPRPTEMVRDMRGMRGKQWLVVLFVSCASIVSLGSGWWKVAWYP